MQHKIIIGEHTVEFLDSDQTILKTLEREKVESHYHCRDGYCGACRCKLIKGEVEYTLEPLAFVREGDVLTCCSKPITDIEIDLHE